MENEAANAAEAALRRMAAGDAEAAGLLVGLFGNNIASSRSPYLHQREADAQGLRLIYRLFDFAAFGLEATDLERMLAAAAAMGFAGLNITYPFKQSIIPLLDEMTDNAVRVGAVNTVLFRASRMIGENTDSLGFAESLRRGLPGAHMAKVVQIGAGGAGAATAHALLEAGTKELVLIEVDQGRAAALADNLRRHHDERTIRVGDDVDREILDADGLVNATPIGMEGHPGIAGVPWRSARGPLGGGHRLFSAGDGSVECRAGDRVSYPRRQWHDGLSGGGGFRRSSPASLPTGTGCCAPLRNSRNPRRISRSSSLHSGETYLMTMSPIILRCRRRTAGSLKSIPNMVPKV